MQQTGVGDQLHARAFCRFDDVAVLGTPTHEIVRRNEQQALDSRERPIQGIAVGVVADARLDSEAIQGVGLAGRAHEGGHPNRRGMCN